MGPFSPLDLVRKQVALPQVEIPNGELVELPGRGTLYVTDVAGPTPDAPVVVLLHALGCTGMLTWFPTVGPLSKRYRVIVPDQRWHGRGIHSKRFSLYDCADDVAALLDVLGIDKAIIAGFSMGSMVSQRVWRQHPERVRGLVLCATTDHFRRTAPESFFHQLMEVAMLGTRGLSHWHTGAAVGRAAAKAIHLEPTDIHLWAIEQFRQTSPLAVTQAVAALGRHHSRPWVSKINVPTAVVVNNRDKVIPTARQLKLARRIPGATIHDIDCGHASCVLESEIFVPAFLQAVNTVDARARRAAVGTTETA